MRYKNIFGILFLITTISSCKCNQTPVNNDNKVYTYSFENVSAFIADSAKAMVGNYLGIKDVHDLTVDKEENTAYFVSDSDVNTTFEQNLTNGNFEFSKLTQSYLSDSSPKLPSKEEAAKIAENFMKSKNIYVRDMNQIRLVHTGGVRSQAVEGGQRAGAIIDKLVTLTYGRTLDNMPVVGSGSKIIVNIGNNGEVVGMTRRWREVNTGEKKEAVTQELLTEAEALEQAKQHIISEFGNVPYDIKSTTKAYYDGNGKFLQPVYTFDVMVNLNRVDKNVSAARYLCIIPMLKNAPEPIQNNVMDPKAKEMLKTARSNDSTRLLR